MKALSIATFFLFASFAFADSSNPNQSPLIAPRMTVTSLFYSPNGIFGGWELRSYSNGKESHLMSWPQTHHRQKVLARFFRKGITIPMAPLTDRPVILSENTKEFFKDLPPSDLEKLDGSKIGYKFVFLGKSVLDPYGPQLDGQLDSIYFYLIKTKPKDLKENDLITSVDERDLLQRIRSETLKFEDYWRGLSLIETDPNQALEYLQAAALRGHADAIYRLSVLTKSTHPQESREYAIRAADDFDHPEAQYQVGLELKAKGLLKEAKSYFFRSAETNEGRLALYELAKLLELERKFEPANRAYLQVCRKSAKRDSIYFESEYRIANNHEKLGNVAQAMSTYAKIAKKPASPFYEESLIRVAAIHESRGRLGYAARVYQILANKGSGETKDFAHFRISQILLKNRRLYEAAELLEKIAQNPKSPYRIRAASQLKKLRRIKSFDENEKTVASHHCTSLCDPIECYWKRMEAAIGQPDLFEDLLGSELRSESLSLGSYSSTLLTQQPRRHLRQGRSDEFSRK